MNQGIERFKYFVGIRSLADIATREDRVCVLNILGNESRAVAPTSHAYSRGNIVFGTSPGRRGEVLETPIGPIPVYNNVRDGLDDGHNFNVGVIHLPPAAVRDGAHELMRVNKHVQKIIILTEKVPVHDSREIRAMAQQRHVDLFGPNCLGVADAWNHVRIGGPLGGERPEESLRKGSVAIFSNSGNFTTTIATYLASSGWGTTTSISSGKDVYIGFAPAEFACAFDYDSRSKAAVMYIEPGGYYEENLEFSKPVIACVVGRWKAKLTRAVGHAGAMGGTGDSAEAKEKWFQENSQGRRDIHPRTANYLKGRCGRNEHFAHPGGIDRGDEASWCASGFRARGRPDAEAVVRQQSRARPAARTRHPAYRAYPALQGSDRGALQAGWHRIPARDP